MTRPTALYVRVSTTAQAGGAYISESICPTCGKAFHSRTARESLRVYCSRACSPQRQLVPIEERFWSKVRRLGPEDCWEWLASKKDDGYGQIIYLRKMTGAHRVALLLTGIEIPPDQSPTAHREAETAKAHRG